MSDPQKLLSLLNGKYSSLTISFNHEHACNYRDAQQWHDGRGRYRGDDEDFIDWASDEERLKAIRENSVWIIQWYPETPVGSYCVGASTFEVAAQYALSETEEEGRT